MTNAISSTFRRAYECFCVQHIKENVKTNVNANVAARFISMAYADTGDQYISILRSVRDDFNEKAHEYLGKLPPNRFARFAVPVSRFGHESSNTVESVNGQLREQREKPILKLLEGIWDRQIQHCVKYELTARQHAETSRFPFTPRACAFLADEQEASCTYRVIPQTREENLIVAKVVSSVSSDARQRIVRLWPKERRGECTCLVFQDMHMPCRHAQKVCVELRLDFTLSVQSIS